MRWRRFLRRQRRDEELAREIESYLVHETDEQTARGMPPEDARYAARRKLGNPTQIREEAYRMNSIGFIETLWHDFRFACRMLRKSPGFAAIAILSLALGIGANTTVFGVVYSVLLRPLPYEDADRIIRIVQNRPYESPQRLAAISTDDLQRWRIQTKTLSEMAPYGVTELKLHNDGQPIPIRGATLSPAMFPLLRATPLLGRVFEPDDEKNAGNGVVILSYAAWQKYLGGGPDVLSRTLNLGGDRYTVVGVMPRGFEFPDSETEFWLPFVLTPVVREGNVRRIQLAQTIARLAGGVSIEAATAEANVLFRGFREEESKIYEENPGPGGFQSSPISIELVRIKDQLVEPVRPALLVLLVAVGLVLLIACANVANLLLARASVRKGEIAIRTALGADRSRLIRQVLTESVMLALLGGVLGILLAYGGVHLVTMIGMGHVPRIEEIRMELPVLGFTFAISILTGILFGLVPAMRLPRAYSENLGKDVLPASSGSDLFGRNRTRSILAAAEISLAMILLAGSGLLIKSFLKLSNFDWGYKTENLLTFKIAAASFYVQTPTSVYEQLLARIEELPAVRSAAVTSSMPIVRADPSFGWTVYLAGQPRSVRPEDSVFVDVRIVSRNYSRTMGMRLIEGRGFGERDRADQPSVMLVNRTLARTLQNQNVVGRKVLLGPHTVEIVGILDDVRYAGLDREPGPEVYLNLEQAPRLVPAPPPPPGTPRANVAAPVPAGNWFATSFAVRTTRDPMKVFADIRSVVSQADSQLILDNVATIEQGLEKYLARPRFYAILLGTFSMIAAALAAVGIYGMMALLVSQRTREIGIRIALGAERGEVLWLIFRQGLVLTTTGILAGLVGALWLTRYLKNLLFGLTATDPLTFVAVAGVVLLVAAFASYVPARRAMEVDPIVALRHE